MASHFIILRLPPPPPPPTSLSFPSISAATTASRTYGSSSSRRNGQQARVFLLNRFVSSQSIPSHERIRRRAHRLTSTTCYLFNPKRELEPSPPSSSPNEDDEDSEVAWHILRRWDVPWKWQTVVLTMAACGVSFVLTGLVETSVLPYLGFGEELSLDEKAEILFAGQFFVTAVVLGVVYGITNTFQPHPRDFFCYDFKEPFDLRDGWLLWAGVGLLGALLSIALAGVVLNIVHGENPQRETDALIRLLPLIGSSSISTACLLGITGVLAPVLEETVFRGFLMVSLTNWFPTPVSVLISAAVFALAHLTPGEFPQLFVLGSALGFSYAQTRNLLTPITIHALWNSGVILLLTFLQIQGYDIRELLQAS